MATTSVRSAICIWLPLISLSMLCSRVESAVILNIDVDVEQMVYNPGDSVNFTIRVTATADGGKPTEGIAGIRFDLTDSGGDTLSPVTFAAPFSDADYDLQDTGTVNGSTLENVRVEASNSPAPAKVDGITRIFATGSFTTTVVGAHELGISLVEADQTYFNSGGTTPRFSSVTSSSAAFTTTAVPEPSTVAVLGVIGIGAFFRYRRARKLGLCEEA